MLSAIKYIITLLILLSPLSLVAQTSYIDSLKHSQDSLTRAEGGKKQEYTAFYFELGGNGGAMSFNYDLRYWSHYSFRLGAGAYFTSDGHTSDLIIHPGITMMASYLFFDTEFHVETGIGAFIDISKNHYWAAFPNNNTRIKPTAVLGLRYQPYFGAMIFRAGYTPYFDLHNYIHLYGLSFGYCIE
ncbi:MAG TPA: hypothetical protein VIX80_05470 [Candidatus Kapabacteria bacterium]